MISIAVPAIHLEYMLWRGGAKLVVLEATNFCGSQNHPNGLFMAILYDMVYIAVSLN